MSQKDKEYALTIVERMMWLEALIGRPDVTSSSIRTAIALQKHIHSKKGFGWPSIARLCKLACLSRATVNRNLTELRSIGAIESQMQGRDRPARYWVIRPEGWKPVGEAGPEAEQSIAPRTSKASPKAAAASVPDEAAKPETGARPPVDGDADSADELPEGFFEDMPQPVNGEELLGEIVGDYKGTDWRRRWKSIAEAERELTEVLGAEAMTAYTMDEKCAIACYIVRTGDRSTPRLTVSFVLRRQAEELHERREWQRKIARWDAAARAS